jgi:hypothetical protein
VGPQENHARRRPAVQPSIPVIALADGYMPLLLGRLLQGVSGG